MDRSDQVSPVQLFDTYFDPALYDESSLAHTTPPPLSTRWDETFLYSVPPLAAAYDAFALSGGIPDGHSERGFKVRFT